MLLDEPEVKRKPKLRWWHILIIVFFGLGMFVFGILTKMLSHPFADLSITIASFILMFSCLLAIIKLIFFRPPNSRLNR